jgi:hypothetical protein
MLVGGNSYHAERIIYKNAHGCLANVLAKVYWIQSNAHATILDLLP